jgi:hypothetical protein
MLDCIGVLYFCSPIFAPLTHVDSHCYMCLGWERVVIGSRLTAYGQHQLQQSRASTSVGMAWCVCCYVTGEDVEGGGRSQIFGTTAPAEMNHRTLQSGSSASRRVFEPGIPWMQVGYVVSPVVGSSLLEESVVGAWAQLRRATVRPHGTCQLPLYRYSRNLMLQ